jgi:hypothetical protein
MNRHLLLYIAAFFLLVSWFNTLRHYLCAWIAHLRTKPSVAKRKGKDKSLPHLFPTKRPECPLCQAEENLPSKAIPPEPPPLIKHKRGRRRSIYTDMRFCPNNDCEYYGWLARGNICSNGHPNSYVKGQGENDVVYLIKALSQLWHYRFIALPGTDAREKQDSISPLFSCVSAISFGFYSL